MFHRKVSSSVQPSNKPRVSASPDGEQRANQDGAHTRNWENFNASAGYEDSPCKPIGSASKLSKPTKLYEMDGIQFYALVCCAIAIGTAYGHSLARLSGVI